MDYRLKIGDEITPVAAEAAAEDTLKIVMGERDFDVSYQVVGDNFIHLTVNGRQVNAYLADEENGKAIAIDGACYRVLDADLVERGRGRKKGLEDQPAEVTPPMPAVVVRVMAAVGDAVEKGQGVVVVSAMKMETTLGAPYSGTVTAVNAAEGDKVMPGQILVEIAEARDAA